MRLAKIGIILALICAMTIFLVSIMYLIFGILLTIVKIFLIVTAAMQIFVLLFASLTYFYPNQKLILLTGFLGLFSFLIPGIILIIAYFKYYDDQIKVINQQAIGG